MPADPAGLAVEAAPGIVATHPGEVIEALADIAEADGADRADWLAKAADAAMHVPVKGDPKLQVVRDAVHDADSVFRVLLANMEREIVALMEDAP